MNKLKYYNVFFLLLTGLCWLSSCHKEKDLAKYVDVFIGTEGDGHTFPGVGMPFGMVQLSPDTRLSQLPDQILSMRRRSFSKTQLAGTRFSKKSSDTGFLVSLKQKKTMETFKYKPIDVHVYKLKPKEKS